MAAEKMVPASDQESGRSPGLLSPSTYVNVHMCVYIYIYKCNDMCMCMHRRMCMCVYVYTHDGLCCACVCVRVSMHITYAVPVLFMLHVQRGLLQPQKNKHFRYEKGAQQKEKKHLPITDRDVEAIRNQVGPPRTT